ncbi:MAG: inorganic phosphate transporter [Spirulinaceae cyanobacterium]
MPPLPLTLTVILAFYVAWNLGANDVANSMGTSVGSKALTLTQAIIVAGVLEFSGAVLFGQKVSSTLATEVANPQLFAENPQVLLLGMVSVLIAVGTWLQIATSKGLPVATSHAVVGAIAGFSWLAVGVDAIAWGSIGIISLAWVITPVISGIVAALFYSIIKQGILDRDDSLAALEEWIPWLSAILLTVFGVIVLPSLFDQPLFTSLSLPTHDFSLAIGAIAAVGLSFFSWGSLAKLRVKGQENLVEKQLGKFQVLSACFVAFAHGSNDVGNAIAPLAAIAYIFKTNTVPINNLDVPEWILILGGLGIVAGLAVQGKKVISTVGEDIIPLQPSSGFCAEIATAATILVASRFGLPVSTSHALVGGVVGIGLLQNWRKVRFQTLKSVAFAWLFTLPFAGILAAICFVILRYFFLPN